MKTCCYFLALLPVVFTLNSCSNKLDPLAGYEESAAVYALLDPNQPVQFVKINKVFTNPNASAADVAKVSDSLYFDTIAPVLVEVETSRRIPLYKANTVLKDAGYFANSPNYLYATSEKIYARNPKNNSEIFHYRLELVLPKTKKNISATTNICDSIRLTSPLSVMSLIQPTIEFSLTNSSRVGFPSPPRSKISDGYFYFNYMEINSQDTTDKKTKTLKWRLVNNYRTLDDNGGETVSLTIPALAFYDMLLSRIEVDPSVKRKFLPCQLELTTGNLEFDNYMQATEPSIGIVQKQTEYSNIGNGIGIFASRRVTNYRGIVIGINTKYAIVNFPEYKILGFTN